MTLKTFTKSHNIYENLSQQYVLPLVRCYLLLDVNTFDSFFLPFLFNIMDILIFLFGITYLHLFLTHILRLRIFLKHIFNSFDFKGFPQLHKKTSIPGYIFKPFCRYIELFPKTFKSEGGLTSIFFGQYNVT